MEGCDEITFFPFSKASFYVYFNTYFDAPLNASFYASSSAPFSASYYASFLSYVNSCTFMSIREIKITTWLRKVGTAHRYLQPCWDYSCGEQLFNYLII